MECHQHTMLEAQEQIKQRERETLFRMAAGTASMEDVRFIAAQLNHTDLFRDCAEPVRSTPIEDDPE